MSVMHVTTCDLCNPGANLHGVNGRGAITCQPGISVRRYGWLKLQTGHACPRCVAEQKANEEADERNEPRATQ